MVFIRCCLYWRGSLLASACCATFCCTSALGCYVLCLFIFACLTLACYGCNIDYGIIIMTLVLSLVVVVVEEVVVIVVKIILITVIISSNTIICIIYIIITIIQFGLRRDPGVQRAPLAERRDGVLRSAPVR